MTELSAYVFSALRDGQFTLHRGISEGLSPVLLVAPTGEYPSSGALQRIEHEYALRSDLDAAWAARPVELIRARRPADAWCSKTPAASRSSGCSASRWMIAPFLRIAIPLATAIAPGARARADPQGHQAGQHPGGHGQRRRLADRLRHRLAPAARAPGPGAAGGDRRHARLHGAGTDRPDEPFDRLPQRPLCAGRHLLRDADRARCRSPPPIRWSGCTATSPGNRCHPASGSPTSRVRCRRS